MICWRASKNLRRFFASTIFRRWVVFARCTIIGFHVPHDVSVVGFDDIQSASYHVPSLTTIRQPLKLMGSTAAAALLSNLQTKSMPDLVRGGTGVGGAGVECSRGRPIAEEKRVKAR